MDSCLKLTEVELPDTQAKDNYSELTSPKQLTPKKKKTCFDDRNIVSRSENDTMSSVSKCESWDREENAANKLKPKLLQQLEFFLKKELYLLGIGSHDVNDIALQAHQEAFEYLIDNFKTYKGILSSIKNSYELTLRKLRSQLQNLHLLKQMVVTSAEKYEKKIMDIYDDKKEELILIEEQNIRLQKNANTLLEEQGNIDYIVDRLNQEINDINENFDSEANHHKMLVTEMNHLHTQQQFILKQTLMHQRSESIATEIREDPILIKNAVKEARERERYASQMLATFSADYSDVIPRKDYDNVKKKFDEETINYEDLMNTYKLFGTEHGVLLKMNQSLTDERDHYYQQLNKLQSIASAVDYWNKCITYITGENGNWEEIASEKATQEFLQILLQTISAKEAAHLEMDIITYTGKGLSEDVPKLLRYVGKVKNRRMTQRDCVYFIKDIWSQRDYADETSFVEFLEVYMMKQFPDDNLRIEWTYTFYYTLKQLSPTSNYIRLFWKIFNEEVDESVYHCQEMFSKHLMNLCHNVHSKHISKTEFHTVLEEFLKGTRADFITSLIEKAITQLDCDKVYIEKLLCESAEGEGGQFLSAIREWLRRAWKNYIENISKIIDIKHIYPDDLANWFQKSSITSMKPLSLIKIQCWCFSLGPKELATAQPVLLENILVKLNQVGFLYFPS